MNKERGKKAPCFKQLMVYQRQSIVFNRELQEPLHAGCFPSFFFLLMNSNVSEKHAFERRKAARVRKKKKERLLFSVDLIGDVNIAYSPFFFFFANMVKSVGVPFGRPAFSSRFTLALFGPATGGVADADAAVDGFVSAGE